MKATVLAVAQSFALLLTGKTEAVAAKRQDSDLDLTGTSGFISFDGIAFIGINSICTK